MKRIHSTVFAPLFSIFVATACDGVVFEVERMDGPVIGGEPTPAGLHPATGALLMDGRFFCTGTLIEPDVVLTAAHCLPPPSFGVPSFTLALDADAAMADEIHEGKAAYAHPDFGQQGNDIGILRLSAPIADVAHETMPSAAEAEELVSGLRVQIVGYRMTEVGSDAAGVKHHGEAELVEVKEQELVISQPGEQQNCKGDSGGPAFAELGDERRIIGIVSRGPEPCDQGGGIDTRVDAYLDWIESTIAQDDGGGGDPDGDDPDGDDPNGDPDDDDPNGDPDDDDPNGDPDGNDPNGDPDDDDPSPGDGDDSDADGGAHGDDGGCRVSTARDDAAIPTALLVVGALLMARRRRWLGAGRCPTSSR